jgi:hypothetical protein
VFTVGRRGISYYFDERKASKVSTCGCSDPKSMTFRRSGWNNEAVVKQKSLLSGRLCSLLTTGMWKWVQNVTGELEDQGGGC